MSLLINYDENVLGTCQAQHKTTKNTFLCENVTIRESMDSYEAGTLFQYVTIDLKDRIIEFWNKDEELVHTLYY